MRDLERIQIEIFLKKQGFPTHLKGFKFLASAIIYMLENLDNELKIMDLYKKIGKKHKATSYKVERDIRYSLSFAKFNINGLRTTNKIAITYLTTYYLEDFILNEKAV